MDCLLAVLPVATCGPTLRKATPETLPRYRLFKIKRQFSNTSTGSAPGGVHLTIPSIETDSSDDDTEIKLPPPPAPKFNHRTVTVKSSTYKHFYELKEPIGGGRFGRVYRCVEKKTGMQLAAKCFQCKKKITTVKQS
uniref:Protein kinase domain-containing protein n=1 Tax=Ciona savignyi TaxID=51511 RepID=H2Z5Z7_CIOSA